MTHIKKIFLTVFILFSLQNLFGQTNFGKYKIVGQVHGFENGTKLYLNDLTDGSYSNQIDSTIINNNNFTFNGKLKSKYLKTAISTTDFEHRVSFWLENGLTKFSSKKGDFRKAQINGTKTQDKQNEFIKLLGSTENTAPIEYSFIKNNPSSIISAASLISYCKVWGKDTVKYLYNHFTKEIKDTYYGQIVKDYVLFMQNIKIGDKFIDFTQKDTSGNNIKLSDFKGKVILLEFWGSWCESCIEKHPYLIELYKEFNQNGFEILEVAAETKKAQWIKAINRDNLPWTNVTELKGDKNKAAIIYRVKEYPTNFLIDRSGTIVGIELYGDELKTMIKKYL